MRDIRQSLMKSENPLFTQQISNPASMLPHPIQHKSPPTLVGTLPQLIKSSCSYDAGADAYVQVDVERNRRWAKWTVNRCDSGMGKISFRDFFPNFPRLNHAHSGMNEVLSHAVRVHGIKTHDVPGSPARTNLTLTIPPPSECNSKVISSVLLDRCTGPRVLVDEIEDEIQMIGCRDLELVVGGHPPKSGVMLSDCSNCHIVVSDKIWRMSGKGGDERGSIRTNSSSAIYLVLVGGGPEHHGAAMNAISISTMRQDRQNVEKVLIPDCFTTVLKDGALSTSCGFSSDFSSNICYPPKQEEQPAVASQPSMPVHSPSIAPAALPMTGIMYSPVQQPNAVEPAREEKTKSEALATPFLGSGVFQFQLKLALDGTAIDAGSYRRNFEIALANDLANSSNLAENNFRVISMIGNLVVNVEAQLKIQEGVYLDSMQLVSILERQYSDSTSRFRNGVITQYTQGIGFPFDLGSGVVGFKHKLEIPFRDAGTEGSVERLKFQNKYLFDLCNASGVEATRFHIKNCAPGSIIIEIEIHPDASGRGPLARNVFANLDKQAMDPESQLRVGVVTRSTKAEAQVGRSGQLPGFRGPTQIQMPPDLPPAIPFDAGASAVQKQALPQPPTTPPAPTYRSSLQLKEQNGSSSPEQLLGARARVHGLQNNIEFNKMAGTVMGAADGGRLRVLLDGEGVGYELGPKPENFSVAPGQMHQQAQAGTAAATDQREVKPLSAPSGAPIDARLYQQVPPQVNSHNDQINQPSPSKRVGIGLGLSIDEKGNIRVSDILPGSICAREGSIQRNDVIERVDGAPVDGMEPNNVVALLRGHENSFVKLDMKRNKWNLTDPTLDIRYSVMLERTPVLQPPSPAHVSLTLDMHMWQIGDCDNFMREVAVDVASALGSMVTKVKAVGLRSGSVIVDLLLTPEVGSSGPHIVGELIEQARSPSSILRNGKHTSRTVGVHSAPPRPVHSGPPPENRQATISSSVSKPIPRTRPSPMTGTLGPSSAFRDNKIVREAEMEIRYNYSSASRGGAPVPLVPQPESVAWANEKRGTPRAGIGLGLTAGKSLVYTVTGLTPGGAAEASGQLQKGDIVHSIDGMIVTGKTVAEIQDVVIGEAGTKVMVAVLRSDALPEDLELDLHQFERWRPVVLVRSIPRFHKEIQQQNGCVYSSQQSVSSIGHHGGNMSAQKSVWPMRNGREIIAVDLVLNEDYRVVASTFADKDSFTAQATHDISTALRVSSTQVSVVDLLPGSVIVVVEFLYAGDHAGARDPEDLALEIMRQASNESSPLRQSVSCRRAKYARPRMMNALMPLKAEATYKSLSSQPASDDDMSSMEGGGQWMALGLVLSKETLDRFCAVKFLRHGGPAEQSGCIFTGNLVISINGRSMDGVSLDQVVNILGEGDWGTVVNVGIMRLRGTKGALPDQNITTVVALRRGLRQMSSVTSPLLSPSQPDAPQATSETESYKLEYTGPCRVVVLQRKFDPMKTRVGVGIVLQRLLSSQQLVVVRMPETGVAAASEQVFIGDVLHQVDNVPTSGRSLEDVVRMLQGLPGTPVVLMLQSTTRQKEALQASSHSHLFSSRRSDTNRSINMPSHVTLRRIYPTPDESTPFRTLRDGSPAGVVGLGLEHEDHSVVISKMAANGSAAQSGMIPIGSRLMSVDGTNVELASLDEIYLLLSGRVDTEVTVGFLPVIQDFVEILTTQDFMEIPLSVEAPLDTPFLQSPERTNAKGFDSATVSMLLIEATNLTEKRQGDSVVTFVSSRGLFPERCPLHTRAAAEHTKWLDASHP
jgi:C-terminal processing protease CtpA/Prc